MEIDCDRQSTCSWVVSNFPSIETIMNQSLAVALMENGPCAGCVSIYLNKLKINK